eukprot:157096_1
MTGNYAIVSDFKTNTALILERNYEHPTKCKQWKQIKTITKGNHFGCSVSMHENKVIIGECVGPTFVAYIFERNTTTNNWTETNKLSPSNGDSLQYFGSSVSIHGEVAIV